MELLIDILANALATQQEEEKKENQRVSMCIRITRVGDMEMPGMNMYTCLCTVQILWETYQNPGYQI